MVERAIAGNRCELDNGAKGKYDRQYAAENGNAAAIKKFKASHDIGESTMLYRLRTRIMRWVWSNIACTKCNY